MQSTSPHPGDVVYLTYLIFLLYLMIFICSILLFRLFLSLLLYVRVLLFSFLLTLSLPVNHLYKYLLRHVDRIRSTLCLVSFPLISVSRFRYELYMEVRRISLRAHTIPNLVSFPCFHFSGRDERSDSFSHHNARRFR